MHDSKGLYCHGAALVGLTKEVAHPPEIGGGRRLLEGDANPQYQVCLLHIFFHDVKHILWRNDIICNTTKSIRSEGVLWFLLIEPTQITKQALSCGQCHSELLNNVQIQTRSCYAMLCYAMLCYAMLCYAMLCYAMLCYAMLRYATLRYAMLRYAMLQYAMLRYATLRYAMLRYAMLCYATLCYATLR